MTFSQMLALLPDGDASVEAIGREFFRSQTSAEDRKQLLEHLLREGRYIQLYRLICSGHLNGNGRVGNGGVASGQASTLNTRYFSLFVSTAVDCGIREEDFVALLFAAATAEKNNPLSAWKECSEQYLIKRAKVDYMRTWNYLRKNDPDFKLVSVLLSADRERALNNLIELAIFGKGINKVALRNMLRGYKAEVFTFIYPIYRTLKNDNRLAAVRLLLLFKNDETVGAFLRELAETERSKSVLALLGGKKTSALKAPQNTDPKQIVKYFYDAMVLATSVPAEKFTGEWIVPPYSTVAETLFFGVYRGGTLADIVVVDKGKVLDIENSPYTFPEGSSVRVLHPAELTAKTQFLSRLNISQPFEQIKRKVFLPSAEDNRRVGCYGLLGRVTTAEDFILGMRKCGFKVLNRDSDGICKHVGISRNGILCVLTVAPIDLVTIGPDRPVQAQNVRFYAENSVIRLGGKQFVDGVAPIAPSEMEPRIFSEFMYSVYELMRCA